MFNLPQSFQSRGLIRDLSDLSISSLVHKTRSTCSWQNLIKFLPHFLPTLHNSVQIYKLCIKSCHDGSYTSASRLYTFQRCLFVCSYYECIFSKCRCKCQCLLCVYVFIFVCVWVVALCPKSAQICWRVLQPNSCQYTQLSLLWVQ